MLSKTIGKYFGIACVSLFCASCALPTLTQRVENASVPSGYYNSTDTLNNAKIKWKGYFTDPNLIALVDSALGNNQELNITLQAINIAKNEVLGRKGAYLPFVAAGTGAGVEKVGEYTSQGANDISTEIRPGKNFPDPLPNYSLGVNLSWEVDIWKKLRNAKSAAAAKYLSSMEGKNFMVTYLIAEIANQYYELMALDNLLGILRTNIEIQQNALEIVKLQKSSAKATELAVKRFEAEVLKNQSRQFYISQEITETENRINFLVGRFPQPVLRNSQTFANLTLDSIQVGVPSQLLANRPDIRQAEQELIATKLDVKSAKANFYPSLFITAGLGYRAFDPKFLLQTPQSLMYALGGQLFAPLINRNAIRAAYLTANARQIQAVYSYEQTILGAYLEVANQLANIGNLKSSYDLKSSQVQALTESIDISINLFKSARADYMEVLLTQRDALESRFELIEIKRQQLHAKVNIYRALGGGWN